MKITKVSSQFIEVPSPGEFFDSIYESAFPNVARYIQKSGGMLEDAKDIFHDALVIYYEKLIEGNLNVEKVAEAYIFGISKHLWLKKRSKQRFHLQLNDTEIMELPQEHSMNENKLLKLLETVGKKCLNLLQGFYYGKMDMKNVAIEFGYSTARSATVQKYKCIEKIRNEIEKKSMTYEDFFE
jgi:DNA-directed RNA polymerase specialized sigma24 family protein